VSSFREKDKQLNITNCLVGVSKYINKAAAWKFIILVGVISLFGDMTYEGARSNTRPFRGVWVLYRFLFSVLCFL